MQAAGTLLKASGGSVDEVSIRKALAAANPAVLRIVLYQLTGDPELVKMEVVAKSVRGGAQRTKVLPEKYHAAVIEKAVAYLLSDAQIPPPPTLEETRVLLRLYEGEDLPDSEIEFSCEELAFDGFPRDVAWTSGPPKDKLKNFHVVVVGAGISGVVSAIYLKRLGIPHTVLERKQDLGGVWQVNNYPEARVDVNSHLYQFKFEKEFRWSELFAKRNETIAYLTYIAKKYDILANFKFNAEVTEAVWDDATSKWTVRYKDGSGNTRVIDANVVVSASGLFSTPNIPDIPGISDFQGAMFHTTAWDHSYDYSQKRIALVGTGSSGTQLMPRVAAAAKHFTVFQRSRHWVIATEGYGAPITPEMRWLLDHVPYYWNWYCYSVYATAREFQELQEFDTAWQAQGGLVNQRNDAVRVALTKFVNTKLEGRPDLIAKCLPDFAPLAKRLVVDNGWYDALKRPNVDLVTDRIQRFTKTGIVTEDGVERMFDMVILGSGYKVSKYLWPVNYVGRNGTKLEDLWAKDGARSYLGMALPGFPNFFMFYGPNGQPRAGGFYSWGEVWSRYIFGAIVKMVEHGASSMEVRRPVFDRYNAALDRESKKLIWEAEGQEGYYVNEFGRSGVNVPWKTHKYFEMVKEAKLDDYELR